MSHFVTRATAAATPGGSQDRADIFARGETAVLVLADGAGGHGDGGAAADLLLDCAREAVLDPDFDLLAPTAWERLLCEVDRAAKPIGETTAVIVVLVPGMVVCSAVGDSEAWIVRAVDVVRLTERASRARIGSGVARPSSVTRGALDGRLVVASDGLFRHAPAKRIVEIMRAERISGVADQLVALPRLPSGELPDDVAVLVAER